MELKNNIFQQLFLLTLGGILILVAFLRDTDGSGLVFLLKAPSALAFALGITLLSEGLILNSPLDTRRKFLRIIQLGSLAICLALVVLIIIAGIQ